MLRLKVAFDVDGTLRSNRTITTTKPNRDIVKLFKLLSKFKNIDLYVWSGGGADYAKRFAKLYNLPVPDAHCIAKFGAPKMDIAIDDMHQFDLADKNLIVRCK